MRRGRHGEQNTSNYSITAGTTNRVAEAAGLSIGSLYQYFPNKDAILAELVRAHIADGTAALERAVADLDAGDGLAARLAAIIDAALYAHRGGDRLHQVLFEEAPRPPDVQAELRQLEATAVDMAEGVLREEPALRVQPRQGAWMVVATIESLVHRYVATHRGPMDSDTFRLHLRDLLMRYLCDDSETTRRGPSGRRADRGTAEVTESDSSEVFTRGGPGA